MKYENLLSYEDLKSRGYDLKKANRLNQGDFYSIDEAVDDFLDEIVMKVYRIIALRKGDQFASFLFEDMNQEINASKFPNAYNCQITLKRAILTQAVFIYENGDKEKLSKVDIERTAWDKDALRDLSILGVL